MAKAKKGDSIPLGEVVDFIHRETHCGAVRTNVTPGEERANIPHPALQAGLLYMILGELKALNKKIDSGQVSLFEVDRLGGK